MGFVTTKEEADVFRRWEWWRRWPRRFFWFSAVLIIFVLYFLITLVVELVKEQKHVFVEPSSQSATEGITAVTGLEMGVLVGLCLVCVVAPVIIQRYPVKWRLGRLSKEACIYAASEAADDLERGNPVRASLSTDKLLSALSDLLGQKLVTLGASSVAPQDFMHVTPETIPRRAVRQAVQASEDIEVFQERLSDLVVGLRGKVDARYIAAHKFLVWLDQKTESYQETSRSYFDKHPTLKTVVLALGPSIIGALGGIAIVVAKVLPEVSK